MTDVVQKASVSQVKLRKPSSKTRTVKPTVRVVLRRGYNSEVEETSQIHSKGAAPSASLAQKISRIRRLISASNKNKQDGTVVLEIRTTPDGWNSIEKAASENRMDEKSLIAFLASDAIHGNAGNDRRWVCDFVAKTVCDRSERKNWDFLLNWSAMYDDPGNLDIWNPSVKSKLAHLYDSYHVCRDFENSREKLIEILSHSASKSAKNEAFAENGPHDEERSHPH